MRRSSAAVAIAFTLFFTGSAQGNAQQPFVDGSDIRFTIRTDHRAYRIDDKITIHYTIRNVSNGALYVPARQWEIKCGVNPHLWSKVEDRWGKHFESGIAASCLGPNPIDRMSLSERMRKDAVLLKPGQEAKGAFDFASDVFHLKPGPYRLEAVLYGWNERYKDAELSELREMGAPFLAGDSYATAPIEFRK